MSSLIQPNSDLKALNNQQPFVFTRGKGIYVYDESGKDYIEGLAGLWCTSLGYGNEELIEAASQQMRDFSFAHLFGGKSHPTAIELADKVAQMVPMKNARMFFGNSGSDANDTHLKMLRSYYNAIGQPQKYKVIARERGYHGVTIAAASLTGIPANHGGFDLPFDALGILRTDCPSFYRNGLEGESEAEFVERLANNLEQLIEKEGADTIAAFIAEPINGAGGVVVPPAGYFKRIQAILKKHSILFLDDEVICGFGRTGNPFGADTFDLKPDMMSLAKALSSAYVPISAAVISGDMYEAIAEAGFFGHGYTYSGHPVACATALKTLEIYQRDQIFAHAAMTGDYLQEQLRTRFSDHPLVGEIRGKSLMAGLELVKDKATKQPFDNNAVSLACQQFAQDEGLVTRAIFANTMAFCPPLIITKQEIDEMLNRFEKALAKTLNWTASN